MNNQNSSNNRSFLQRPGAVLYDDPDEALEQITGGTVTSSTTTSAVVGTPEDLVAAIRQVAEVTGGFGKVIGFAHDWANREDTLRSWDLVARYVIPEVNGLIARASSANLNTKDLPRHRRCMGPPRWVSANRLANEGHRHTSH